MGMTLKETLERQYLQQERIVGPRPQQRAEQREMAKKFSHYLIRELYEYLDAMSFKHFLPLDEKPRETRLLELVDVYKYWGALCWLEGVTPAEFEHLFIAKTDVVDERHRKKLLNNRVCGFDIDGVLAKHAWRQDDSEETKEEFFESGGALRLEPYAGARETLEALKASGWGIVLVTARKVSRHSRLEYETHAWLKQHGIPYDLLLFGYDKEEALAKSRVRLTFFVEDHPKHALDIAKSGVEVLLLRNREASHGRIHYINDIGDVSIWAKAQGDLRQMPEPV